MLKGTFESFKVLKRCPQFWNDEFLQKLQEISADKRLHLIRTVSELNGFVDKHVPLKDE